MSRIFLLRHGESEFNAGNFDVHDARLTDLGKRQASKVTGHFDIVLCSPLTRAKQTLQFSAVTYDQFQEIPDARERKKDKSDFFPFEETKPESIKELIGRVRRLIKLNLYRSILYTSIQRHDILLVFPRVSLFIYLLVRRFLWELVGRCLGFVNLPIMLMM